jgi:hypothetical protein
MNAELNELATVLEEEIAVGEQLRCNLAAQRQALVVWDMEALITEIEAREPLLRLLGELEGRRLRILSLDSVPDRPVTLSALITDCKAGLPTSQRLRAARASARETFSRLQTDQNSLNGLMLNLMSHLHEALRPLARPVVALYGDTGAAAIQRPSTALVRNRA